MEGYKRKVKCIMKDCSGIVEVRWNNKNGFKIARCPDCGRIFEPYLETRLKLVEIEESTEEKCVA